MTASKKILIVEDDTLLLLTLVHQFERAGYAVVSAGNGKEGTEKFALEKPDAVLTDVMMPSMDGIAMLNEIRSTEAGLKTPFVFLSNSSDLDVISRALSSGAVAYLLKSDRQIDSIVGAVEEKLKGLG